jgi:hypothetical protein
MKDGLKEGVEKGKNLIDNIIKTAKEQSQTTV